VQLATHGPDGNGRFIGPSAWCCEQGVFMPNKNREIVYVEIPSKALRIHHAACSNGHSLMCPDHLINGYASVCVKVRYQDNEGLIYLDPIYGSFCNVTEIQVPDRGLVEFFCPSCGISLTAKQQLCTECGAPMFELALPRGGTVAGCLRNGCHFHLLKLADGVKLLDSLADEPTWDSFL